MWWLRFINFLVTAKFRPKAHYLEEVETKFRAWFGDMDANIHMNNSAYFSIMDFGR